MEYNYLCIHNHYFPNIGLKVDVGKRYKIIRLNKFVNVGGKQLLSDENLYIIEYDNFCAIITLEDLKEYFISI